MAPGRMDVRRFLTALRHWWWLVVALPVLALIGSLILTPKQPYTTTFRATVLIPGDTEDTGSAERPELMVLDDLPSLIGSQVYAGATLAQMKADGYTGALGVADVQGTLSGTRYSRVLTVTVSSHDPATVKSVAAAAANVLPGEVNTYLVADGTKPAKVQLIDAPGEPARGGTRRLLQIAVQTFVAFCVAIAIVVLVEGVRDLTAEDANRRTRRTAPDTASSEAPSHPAR